MTQIDELVKELRSRYYQSCSVHGPAESPDSDCHDAADVLEAQAAELTRLREQCEAKDAEIERLKAERDEARHLLDAYLRSNKRVANKMFAENERLLKALENIKEKSSGRYGGGKLLEYIHAKAGRALAAHVGEEK